MDEGRKQAGKMDDLIDSILMANHLSSAKVQRWTNSTDVDHSTNAHSGDICMHSDY